MILWIFVGFSTFAQSQKDPKAKAILDGVSQKYQSLKGLQASFEYTYENEIDGSSQTNSGEVTIKGNSYLLKLDNQEIYNNGNTVWTYIESNGFKEVTINNVNTQEDELTPSSVYNMYKKGFNYQLLGEKNENGKTIQVVELTAEKANAPFKRVKLMVDKAQKDLIGWEIFDDQGTVFRYKFKDVDTNIDLKDDFFTFNASNYGKVEVIDLR